MPSRVASSLRALQGLSEAAQQPVWPSRAVFTTAIPALLPAVSDRRIQSWSVLCDATAVAVHVCVWGGYCYAWTAPGVGDPAVYSTWHSVHPFATQTVQLQERQAAASDFFPPFYPVLCRAAPGAGASAC
eukprot:366203-Chlamydomonas_euryale.AAC.11